MKIRLTLDSERPETEGVAPGSMRAGSMNRPSTRRNVAVACLGKAGFLGGLIFRILRETLSVLVMITDPERVHETLVMLESEPGRLRNNR